MTKQTPLQLLEQARSLIEDEDRWSRHYLSEASEHAGDLIRRYNAEGALIRCYHEKYIGMAVGVFGEAYKFLDEASESICHARAKEMAGHHYGVFTLNKILGHEAVLEAYDKAIIEAKVAEYRAKLEGGG